MQSATKLLLGFIISQKLELDQYFTLESPLKERFYITKDCKDATNELIEFIIWWENQPYGSLETLINQNFFIKNK